MVFVFYVWFAVAQETQKSCLIWGRWEAQIRWVFQRFSNFFSVTVSMRVNHFNYLSPINQIYQFCAGLCSVAVLMLLGFMSLILAVTQRPISRICIPTKVANTLLPCRKSSSTKTTKAIGFAHLWAATPQNSLSMKDLFEGIHLEPERRLVENDSNGSSDYCESQVLHTSKSFYCLVFIWISSALNPCWLKLQGKTSFISQVGINQLNNFVFVLAIMQIVYSVLTMALGRAKVCTMHRANYIHICFFLHV